MVLEEIVMLLRGGPALWSMLQAAQSAEPATADCHVVDAVVAEQQMAPQEAEHLASQSEADRWLQ